jgi:uncharacterized membrane protein HdeD (DUF308 family)
MEPKLAALSIFGTLTAADLVVSGFAMTLGAFAAASPRRAVEIWASERLRNMTPERQASFVRWYRVFGIVLFLTGVFFVLHGG